MWSTKHARTQDARRIKTLADPTKMETLCVDCVPFAQFSARIRSGRKEGRKGRKK